MLRDTIFAQATAPGRAGLAVIRISGPDARCAAEALSGRLPSHGRSVRTLRDRDGEILDEALVLTFAEGRSSTGEIVAELHLHGSTAVVSAVLRVLAEDSRLRMADPGEFTRRALENGRLDLAQVEGLADLIDAETEAQRRQALRVFSGKLKDLADGWRGSLLRAMALIEATIDFADEEVPADVSDEVSALIIEVRQEMWKESAGVAVAERIRDGFEVAIIGRPNVGKSSLLNILAGREAAITSEMAGTTRDVIEVRLDLEGLPVTLLDTAGLREAEDALENIGIAKGRTRAKMADLRVYIAEPGEDTEVDLEPEDIVVQGKADLLPPGTPGLSARTGAGIDQLVDRIGRVLRGRAAAAGTAMRARHRMALDRAIGGLDRAMAAMVDGSDSADIVAEELRGAVRAVDMMVGRIDVEDVLGEIFASFCVGK